MDLFPLWNSLRIAGISTVIIFFVGIFAAYYIAKAPRAVKGGSADFQFSPADSQELSPS